MASLWSGLSPTLVLAVPATIVYFTTYEQLRQIIKDRQKITGGFLSQQPIWLTSLTIGAIARVWAVTLVSPLELIRTKMQSKKLSYNGTYHNFLFHAFIYLNDTIWMTFIHSFQKLEWLYVR